MSAAAPDYNQLATDMVALYASGDTAALQRINDHYGRPSTAEDFRATVWRLIYKVRRTRVFGESEARELIARTAGFNSWTSLTEAAATGTPAPVPFFKVRPKRGTLAINRDLTDGDWATIVEVIKEHGIAKIEANGFMSDAALSRIARLDCVTALNLSGSRQLSDDGLKHLARMPQLELLELSEYPGGKLTDKGLEVLRHLPNLRGFTMTWQRGISDTGAGNLKYCDKLENVDLMGTPTGNGVIEALCGKPLLRKLSTGRLVTDEGLALLSDYPMFRTWREAASDDERTSLLIDGPFTNRGLESIQSLDGLFALDLFWHVTGITSEGFADIAQLPNLGSLGCDGELSDNAAMGHIGSMPRLRKLRAQGTVATDEGFIALSRSQTLENFWGRECPNLTGRGFTALAEMPALRTLGVSCKNVDDAALANLPSFPALRDLTPIDVQDDGFRHIGKCKSLTRLSCMYCRDTTDTATGHIADLHLTSYYAGLTKITDRSLGILGRMDTLESIEFYETKGVTDAGLAHLASLPALREVHIFGLPEVTQAGASVFPAHVEVEYNV